MKREKRYQYYVEGETERKLIDILKSQLRCIQAGRVEVFNVMQEHLSRHRVMRLSMDTIVILVYDTDGDNSDILKSNLKFLSRQTNIKEIICVPQVKNLEEELIRSCEIRQIKELTGSRSNKEFKADMIHQSNLEKKLVDAQFDIKKFWATDPVQPQYTEWKNQANKIKK